MRKKGIDKYANSQTTMCIQYTGNTIDKQECVHNTQTRESKNTYVLLQEPIVLDYKRTRQSIRVVVRIQSALCEVGTEQNSRV